MTTDAGTAPVHMNLPRGNSTWVYDSLYRGDRPHGSDPGSFVDALNRYNAGASPKHAITRVFTYGGSLEMYCHGNPAHCEKQDLKITYGEAGHRSVAAYTAGLHPVAGQSVAVVPVIDGSIRAHYPGSLHGFDQLSPGMAKAFADKVAQRMCADPQVAGVQFDLEPFKVEHKNGQYYFYRRIAEDFAGRSGSGASDPFGCVDAAHPQGRTFSIFGAAHSLNPEKPEGQQLREILTTHHNGFFIVALYDLSSQPAGHPSTPAEYLKKAKHQASMAVRGAQALQVPYQFAVPASATGHEYAHCDGASCQDREDQVMQIDYLRAALQAVAASGARASPLYLGTALWAWSRAIVHGGMRFSPSTPTPKELQYLRRNL